MISFTSLVTTRTQAVSRLFSTSYRIDEAECQMGCEFQAKAVWNGVCVDPLITNFLPN
ncbi:hypothetical protein RB4465 [Rhodopirellula baltica SH 1]|uniref:Uncharacterized protein n=1 Tax=Rhodopirellula baltica (strain DSM 10527 / NCIMB 13988 / SH1) TaxID=243090 RepID=Q7USJ3_RHOBA|nr:hypothetical protein RB4465 [Rhodopirellula baltica SH 1]